MSEPYRRKRSFYQDISGSYRSVAADTGIIHLVAAPANSNDTYYIQKLHIEITTVNGGGELYTFQDGAGTPIPIVPSIATSAIAHFDFDFGPEGVPCTQGTSFDLNITAATGAISWISWEGYKKRTGVTAA